ncbi:lung adenoma susceptibility protein 2 [Stegostoma tigrinum]|uniref:lung adenoma susceptibility protein 2 n=1 Tax=Stegostoma tigrinum TaxID=3053191 RepID=UPI00202B7E31|nr:lung adenoma susceptibility protein 2 [Stegostoma tigrinum]
MSMNGMNDRVDFESHESTVSGLLTSAGHLNSFDNSYGSTQFHSSVLYRGRTYQSASEALEAYIDNFEKKSPSTLRGESKLRLGSISKLSPTSVDSKKEVFRERHSFRDLDFPSWPLRRRIASDLDLESLTTDDLLEMPTDGSLPLTRSSVLQGSTQTQQRTGSHFNHNCSCTFTKYAPKVSPCYSEAWHHKRDDSFELFCGKDSYFPLNQTTGLKRSQFSQLGMVPQDKNKYLISSIPPTLPVDDCRIGKHYLPSVSQHNYPRWLTSQKSELGVSGISSIPELKYPGWVLDCDLGSDSCEHETLNEREYLLSTGFKIRCSNSRLHCGSAISTPKHKHFAIYSGRDQTFHKHTGRDLLRRAPALGKPNTMCTSQGVEGSDYSKPFRGEHIDLLIQKAERVHEVLSQQASNPQQNQGSPGTEDVLEAERSWENPPVTFKSPVPVGSSGEDFFEASNPAVTEDVYEDLFNSGHQRNHSGSSGISGGKHHGPVEALKQMLFSLQTVQQSFDDDDAEENKEIRKIPENMISQTLGLDFEEAPGNRSLQRALNHLKHLKDLVDDIGAKMEKEA